MTSQESQVESDKPRVAGESDKSRVTSLEWQGSYPTPHVKIPTLSYYVVNMSITMIIIYEYEQHTVPYTCLYSVYKGKITTINIYIKKAEIRTMKFLIADLKHF